MRKIILLINLIFVSGLLFAQTDILPPQLVSPDDGDDRQIPDVVMNWLPSAGIGDISYELHYDTTDQFTNPVMIETMFTSAQGIDLLFGSVYYWRVRAMDDNGTSDWSDVFSFSTFDKIDLHKPSDASTGVDPKAQMLWKTKISGTFITGVTFYDYELSLDTNFNEVAIAGSHPFGSHEDDTNYYFVFVNQLLFDTTYYWHVKARHDADESEWSDTWSFNTLVGPTNSLPSNGATDQMLDVTMQWQEVDGAFEYIYELCDDPNFSSPCIFFADDNSVTPMGLMFGTTYYWRVKAAHTADTSEWSEVWEFETINTVGLVSPENEGYVNDLFPTLSWEEVTGVSGFEIMYAKNENFNDAELVHVGGDEYSYKILTAANMDDVYYWKVRAYEDGDTTMWSDAWSFTIGEAPQSVNDLLSEKSVKVYPNPVKSYLYIEIDAKRPENVSLEVLNLLGQSVVSEGFKLSQGMNSKRLDLNRFENGIYILKLESGDNTFTKKVIIDH